VARRGSEGAAQRSDEPIIATASLGGQSIPVPRFGAFPPDARAEGDIEAMCMLAGQSVGLVGEIKPAAEIVRDLVEGARRIAEERLSPRLAGLAA
jgi:NAD(P)H-dependent flavin oxidoreductase YrpB (nitropropane dioxygenase family)